MKYQLVIQKTETHNLDNIIALEDELSDVLDGEANVDGHDIGSGEANIFIITNNPEANYKKIKAYLGKRLEKERIRIAYRKTDGEEYVPLYPDAMKDFSIK
jgi:hypothetical protein